MEPPTRERAPAGAYDDERDDDLFWRTVRPRSEPSRRRWFLPGALAVVIAGAPWWLPTAAAVTPLGGLPLWVWLSIASAAALAALTSWAVLRHWQDDEPG